MAVCICGLALAAVFAWFQDMRFQARRDVCTSRLRSIGCVINMYATEDHNGALPPTISALTFGHVYVSPALFRCPSKGINAVPPDGSTVDDWMDYLYIYWPEGKNTPKDYPLLYDRRLSNHKGKGICILRIEGIGDAPKLHLPLPIWDENAEWLKKFAKEHPECNIPLPEDLQNISEG